MKSIFVTVIIYTLTHCPYCTKAKKLLNQKNISYEEIIVDNYNERQRLELQHKASGQLTLPQIFINGKHIGGCDALYELEKAGKLDELVK
ncbi:glutaredoxin 3 [Rickettsia endosymbiont of Oedothorax gibbosus]|uniref:glutaredoxin 3 n=1 Tax=Rickettsia endosymbiont of Oedothorax gibbosus TaxID=931099 RepID=UPI0020242FEE|nr:glutaredoxin 3 [Rickettsia endosymbiont of Oedothorax gibbosus]